MAKSKRHDIIIDQGSPFELQIDLLDANGDPDPVAYTAAGKMKRYYTSTNSYSFDCSVSDSVLTVSMTSTYTANVVPGRYVYDIEIYDTLNDYSRRLIEGVATVTPGVT